MTVGTPSLYLDTREGGVRRWVYGDKRDLMRVPSVITKCIVYLCVPAKGGTTEEWVNGATAFFVSVPSATNKDLVHVYLVTARHALKAVKEGQGRLGVRANTKDGSSVVIEITNLPWVVPGDESIDIAVTPFILPEADFDVGWVSLNTFASDNVIDRQAIGIGDDILVTGLFRSRSGNARNIPIVRQGVIAAMPEEPIFDHETGQKFDAYLAELRSIGGLSGSPVFALLGPGRVNERDNSISSQRVVYLLGVLRGHWDVKQRSDGDFLAEDTKDQINTGIAMVTPVMEVIKLLADPKLAEPRKETDEQIARERAGIQVQDSDFVDTFTREDFLGDLTKVTRPVEESDQASS